MPTFLEVKISFLFIYLFVYLFILHRNVDVSGGQDLLEFLYGDGVEVFGYRKCAIVAVPLSLRTPITRTRERTCARARSVQIRGQRRGAYLALLPF